MSQRAREKARENGQRAGKGTMRKGLLLAAIFVVALVFLATLVWGVALGNELIESLFGLALQITENA